MRFASIGIRAAWRCWRPDRAARGFTLLEALVALAVLLAFAGALGPYLFQARRLVDKAGGRVAAHVLLRSLLEVPLDRDNIAQAGRDGVTNGLHWRIVTQPMFLIKRNPPRDPAKVRAAASATPATAAAPGTPGAKPPEPDWMAFKVTASVSWAPGELLSAETVRLGKVN